MTTAPTASHTHRPHAFFIEWTRRSSSEQNYLKGIRKSSQARGVPLQAFGQHQLITVARAGIKANEEELFEGGVLVQKGERFPGGNARGSLQGKSIDAGADGGKGHAAHTVLDGELQGSPVTIGQQLILGFMAA